MPALRQPREPAHSRENAGGTRSSGAVAANGRRSAAIYASSRTCMPHGMWSWSLSRAGYRVTRTATRHGLEHADLRVSVTRKCHAIPLSMRVCASRVPHTCTYSGQAISSSRARQPRRNAFVRALRASRLVLPVVPALAAMRRPGDIESRRLTCASSTGLGLRKIAAWWYRNSTTPALVFRRLTKPFELPQNGRFCGHHHPC
jgi:hypothetical protein